MNLATPHTSADQCNAWLATNGALWCHRHSATITAAACLANMYASERKSSDLRCAGCGGLDNQPEPGRSFLPPVMVEDSEVDNSPAGIGEPEEEEFDLSDLEDDDFAACSDEGGLSDFDRELLDIFERESEESEPESRPAPVKKSGRWIAVFMGRCRRCGGYMSHSPEYQGDWKDIMAYRCLACGWRTSPGYEQNRILLKSGNAGQGIQCF